MPEILLLWRIAVKKGSTAIRKRNRVRGSPCLTPRRIVKVGVRKPFTRISDVASVCRVAIVSTNLCVKPYLVKTLRSHWWSTESKAFSKSRDKSGLISCCWNVGTRHVRA